MEWIFLGDFNKMNEKPILNLSKKFKQIVKFPTRLNPDSILDKIIPSISHWYCEPVPLPPLQCDEGKTGKPSDHLAVLWEPLHGHYPARSMRTVTVRPHPDSAIRAFGLWVSSYEWNEVFGAVTASEKAYIFQKILIEKYDHFFPEKVVKFRENDAPWVTQEVRTLDRQRKRAWRKDKLSDKYRDINAKYLNICKREKIDILKK